VSIGSSQSAVIGVPHPQMGRARKALVVLRPGRMQQRRS